MRFRASLSAALVLLVLTMSTWATACDLLCSFDRMHFSGLHTGCNAHGDSLPAAPKTPPMAAGMTMNDMAMDQMAMPSGNEQTAPTADSPVGMAATMGSCAHEPCSQTAISVAAKRGIDCSPLGVAGAVVVAGTHFAAGFLQVRAEAGAETPPRAGPLDPLGTTLRI